MQQFVHSEVSGKKELCEDEELGMIPNPNILCPKQKKDICVPRKKSVLNKL